MGAGKRFACERESWFTLTGNWRSLDRKATAAGWVPPVKVVVPSERKVV